MKRRKTYRRHRGGGTRHSRRQTQKVGTKAWKRKVNAIQRRDRAALLQLQTLEATIGDADTVMTDTTNDISYTTEEIDKDDAFIILLINVHGSIFCDKTPVDNTLYPLTAIMPPEVQMLNRIIFTVPGYSDVAYHNNSLLYDKILETDIKTLLHAPGHKVVYGDTLKTELDELGIISYKKTEIYKDEPILPQYEPFLFRSEMYINDSVQLRAVPQKYYSNRMHDKVDYYSDITVLYQQNGQLREGDTIFKRNLAPFMQYMAYTDETIKKGVYYISIRGLVQLLLDHGYTKIQLIDFTCEVFNTDPATERERRRIVRGLLR